MSEFRKQLRDHYESKALPASTVEAIFARARREADGGKKVTQFPLAHRTQWPRLLALAAVLAIFAGLAKWWPHDARAVEFAAVPQRITEFFAAKEKIDPAPQDKTELHALLVSRGAPAGFHIPAALLPLKSAACQVVDVRGHSVYLACFQRPDGEGKGLPGLVHLILARRGDFLDTPVSAQPQLTECDGWSFAMWSEDDIAYTLATAAPLATLRPFIAGTLQDHREFVTLHIDDRETIEHRLSLGRTSAKHRAHADFRKWFVSQLAAIAG